MSVGKLAVVAVFGIAVGCNHPGLPLATACSLDDAPASCVVEQNATNFTVVAMRGVERLELDAPTEATADPPHIEITDAAGSTCESAAGGAAFGVEGDQWCARFYFVCGGAAAQWQRHAVCMAVR